MSHVSPSTSSSLGSDRHFSKDSSPVLSSESPNSIRRKPLPFTHVQSVSEKNTAISIADTSGGVPDRQPKRKNIFSLWKWELLSLLTSTLSFVAIIILLWVYQNRLLSEWTLPISINAIVAILSALFKGALAIPVSEGISQLKWLWFSRKPRSLVDMDLYDKASRGAWGATIMLFKQFGRGPKSFLAGFGALLAVITLAVDPFSQATATVKPCWRRAADEASIPRANNYTTFGAHAGAGSQDTLDSAMSLAAYLGVLKPPANSSVSVPINCRTGNCTLASDRGATFTSLGICTLSWDITDEIEALPPLLQGWNYSIPYGATVSLSKLLDTTALIVPGTAFAAPDEGPWNRTSLFDVQMLGMRYKNASCSWPNCSFVDSPDALEPVAYSFSLIPCVQTFSARFHKGVYEEEVIDERFLHWVLQKRDSQASIGYQLALNETFYNGTWQECTSTDEPTDSHTVEVFAPSRALEFDEENSPKTSWYEEKCVYGMRPGPANAIAGMAGYGFFGNGTLQFVAGNDKALTGPVWIQSLWNSGRMSFESVTAAAKGLALSISAQMRINPTGPEDLSKTRGAVWDKETCIRVEWKFLSFLAVLLGLEIIFFTAVLVLNHRSSWDADWKSSTLAVAYQNVGSTASRGGLASSPEMDRDLRDAAEIVKVSFTDVDGKWQLRRENEAHAY